MYFLGLSLNRNSGELGSISRLAEKLFFFFKCQMRKRARPKILLATNYEDAAEIYNKYRNNILGIISDIGFTMRKNDPPTEENLEAGLHLARMIKNDNPYVPILLQSSQESLRAKAEEIGCGFLVKYSMTLLLDLSEYIKEDKYCMVSYVESLGKKLIETK